MTQLHVEYDCLAAGDFLLLRLYDAGDCDSIPWPMRNANDAENLRSALYDAREMGFLPIDCQTVLLPDGTSFDIEEPYEEYLARLDHEAERTFALQHGCVNRL